uniref:C2H2-type domain-containing protein n=1 Tax=Ditylenchus dipsaci TaxID=166011 RepID=A0A915D864_9BILA
MLKCCVCSDNSSLNANELEAHIAAVHYDCTPYECDHCKYSKFPTEYAVRRHFEVDHGLFEYYVKFQECLERCLQDGHPKLCKSAPSKLLNPVFKSKKEVGAGQEGPSDALPLDVKPVIELGDSDQEEENSLQVLGCDNQPITSTPSSIITAMRNSCSSNSSCVAAEETFGPLEVSAVPNLNLLSSRIKETVKKTENYQNTRNSKFVEKGISLQEQEQQAHNIKNNELLQSCAETSYTSNPQTSPTPEIVANSPSTITPYIHPQLHLMLTLPRTEEPRHSDFLLQDTVKERCNSREVQSPDQTLPSTSLASFAAALVYQADRDADNDGLVNQSGMVECIMCKEMVENDQLHLNKHVNTRHTKLPFYKCKDCGLEFLWSKQEALNHMQFSHPGKTDSIIDNWDRFYPRLNLRQPRFFNQKGEESEDLSVSSNMSTGLATANVFEHPSKSSSDTYEPTEALDIIDQSQMIISDFNQLLRGASSFDMPTPSNVLSEMPHINVVTPENLVGGRGLGRSPYFSGSKPRVSTAKGRKHACTKCKEQVTALDWTLLNHVNSHMHLPLFECLGCNKTFEKYLRSYMVRHVKHHHNSDINLIVDHRNKYKKELADGCLQFFPKDYYDISLGAHV